MKFGRKKKAEISEKQEAQAQEVQDQEAQNQEAGNQEMQEQEAQEQEALDSMEQITEIKSGHPKKKKKAVVAVFLVAVLACGGGFYAYAQTKVQAESTNVYQEVTVEKGDLSLDLTESGTTAVGTVSQLPEFDVSTVDMVIEEVYVEAGAEVSAGDALYKLTDDCVAELTAYYEELVEDAETALETAELNYTTGKEEASYDKQSSDNTASYAEAQYQAGLEELALAVSSAQTTLENAQTQISTYQSYIDNNTYYTENGIAEKETAVTEAQTAYDTAAAACQTAYADYQAAKDALQTGFATEDSSFDTVRKLYDILVQAEAVYTVAEQAEDDARNTLTIAQKDLESAKTKYETQVSNAQEKVDTLTSSLTSLQSAYDTAVINQTTQAVELEKTYNEAVLNGNYSDVTYETTVNSLKNTMDAAQDTLDQAKEEQAAVLALENGVITASQDGMLASVTYAAEDTMISGIAEVTYYKTDTISISVEVPQTDISKIAVGDSVTVSVSGYRGSTLEGTVSSVATSATSDGSISNVYYTVVVSLDNSSGDLSTGSSASVVFTFGSLTDVMYLPVDAVNNISGDSGEVKQYDADGNAVSKTVTVGDSTDQYIVVTEGLSEGDVCLIAMEQKS